MDTVRHASHGALLRFGAAAGFFCALALTGAARASTPPIPAANLFTNLHPCEFAGLRERMISRGARTQTFAGEFTPTRTPAWTTGRVRIVLYVVSGSGIARTNTTARIIRAGDVIVIPTGTRHAVTATTSTMRAIFFEERNG